MELCNENMLINFIVITINSLNSDIVSKRGNAGGLHRRVVVSDAKNG